MFQNRKIKMQQYYNKYYNVISCYY